MPAATIDEAIAAIAAGRMVIVVDDEDRENEGDLIVAAEYATPEVMAFFVRHTSGLICASITSERADELDLPLMVARNTESQRTAFTVTVDYPTWAPRPESRPRDRSYGPGAGAPRYPAPETWPAPATSMSCGPGEGRRP